MKVCELLALVPRLEAADPEDTIVINPGAESVLLFNTRPGLFQPAGDPADLSLTEQDVRFLRALHVGP
jgi:hypothetical protein